MYVVLLASKNPSSLPGPVRDACDNAVYLIDRGATCVAAAAGDRSNQVKFMQIMGLVGEDATISEGQEHAPTILCG